MNRIYWLALVLMGLFFKILSFIAQLTRNFLFFRIRVFYKKNLLSCKAGPLIITPNHKSSVDHFIILAAMLPYCCLLPVRTFASDKFFKVKWYKGGWLIRLGLGLLGAIPINHGRGTYRALKILEKEKGVVVIYPEGGVNYKDEIGKFFRGAGFLAEHSQAPVLPIIISGLGRFTIWNFFFGRKCINVKFGSLLETQGLSSESITEQVRAAMIKLYSFGK